MCNATHATDPTLRADANVRLPCDDCGAPVGFVRLDCCDPGTCDDCDA